MGLPQHVLPMSMRGSGDELEARIALEGKIFNERLQSPEAKTALEAFFARKR
jgi:hypothetical protein